MCFWAILRVWIRRQKGKVFSSAAPCVLGRCSVPRQGCPLAAWEASVFLLFRNTKVWFLSSLRKRAERLNCWPGMSSPRGGKHVKRREEIHQNTAAGVRPLDCSFHEADDRPRNCETGETGESWNRLYPIDSSVFRGNDAYINIIWKRKPNMNNLKKKLLKWQL